MGTGRQSLATKNGGNVGETTIIPQVNRPNKHVDFGTIGLQQVFAS